MASPGPTIVAFATGPPQTGHRNSLEMSSDIVKIGLCQAVAGLVRYLLKSLAERRLALLELIGLRADVGDDPLDLRHRLCASTSPYRRYVRRVLALTRHRGPAVTGLPLPGVEFNELLARRAALVGGPVDRLDALRLVSWNVEAVRTRASLCKFVGSSTVTHCGL